MQEMMLGKKVQICEFEYPEISLHFLAKQMLAYLADLIQTTIIQA